MKNILPTIGIIASALLEVMGLAIQPVSSRGPVATPPALGVTSISAEPAPVAASLSSVADEPGLSEIARDEADAPEQDAPASVSAPALAEDVPLIALRDQIKKRPQNFNSVAPVQTQPVYYGACGPGGCSPAMGPVRRWLGRRR